LEKEIRENTPPDKYYAIGFLEESSLQTALDVPRL
jgi:hypothetical protein